MRTTTQRQLIAFVFLLASAITLAHAQQTSPPPGLVFRPSSPASATPLIINAAQQSNPRLWPATFYVTSPKTTCTSTIVGPRVILTAAHCVPADTTGAGTPGIIESGADQTAVHCFSDPGYQSQTATPNKDLAACIADGDIAIPYGGGYERIVLDATLPKALQPVRLIGYGCRQELGGGPDGELWDGQSFRDSTPIGPNDAIVLQRGAASCFGDSGGGSYIEISTQRRMIVGVVSESNLTDVTYLARIGIDKSTGFFNDITNKHSAQVCGRDPAVDSRCHP
jgi:hypothetical protein